jgi:hypothetical protein
MKPDRWADRCMEAPAYYTTSRFLGRGRYDTRQFDTLDKAKADALGDRRAMIYVVTSEGFSAHLGGTRFL